MNNNNNNVYPVYPGFHYTFVNFGKHGVHRIVINIMSFTVIVNFIKIRRLYFILFWLKFYFL